MHELSAKNDVIKTLCQKVAFLEGTMKIKDDKITALTSQMDQLQEITSSTNTDNYKPRSPTLSTTGARKRSRLLV